MEERAFCELGGLKGMKKRKVDGYLIKEADESYIRTILEKGCACTAAGSFGSLNIWKTDAGIIRGEAMQRWSSLDKKVFSNYAEATAWAAKWIDRINGVEPIVEKEETPQEPAPNYAFRRDVERILMKTQESIYDAFCDAGCGKRLNFDGYGNPCPRNYCAKFNDFARRIKMRSIRGLETQEAKDIVAKYTKSDPDKAV